MFVDVWTKRGLEQGRIEGIREDLRLLLERKFGLLGAEVNAKTESLSMERSREIMLAILDAKSLAELGLE